MDKGEIYVNPDISFLIPVFNMADTLPDALESLSSIREFPFEIVVIDDGSTDSLEEVLQDWKEYFSQVANIQFLCMHQLNMGRAHALNEAAKLASAEYLSFVDADDLVDAEELKKMFSFLKSSPKDLILGQFRVIAECGREISCRYLNPEFTKKQLLNRLLFSPLSPVHLNAFFVRRGYYLDVGGMDPNITKSQDKDFVIRLLRGTDSINICESTHYVYKKYSLQRRVLIRKRCQWLYYRQKMIRKNFTGFNKYSSMVLQGTYDLAKLCYEGVFQYRL